MKPYGAFVRLSGFRRNALCPAREISEHLEFSKEDGDDERVRGIEGVVSANDPVWVKIVDVQEGATPGDPPRVTCSIRLCDQRSGEDLDPAGQRYRPAGERGGGPGGSLERRQIGANAGDRVKAHGVIDWGHHLGDVRGQMRMGGGDEGKTYDLVEADPDAHGPMGTQRAIGVQWSHTIFIFDLAS